MTKKEFEQLTADFLKAQSDYTDYLNQFVTIIGPGAIVDRGRPIQVNEAGKLKELRDRADALSDQWLDIAKNQDKLPD